MYKSGFESFTVTVTASLKRISIRLGALHVPIQWQLKLATGNCHMPYAISFCGRLWVRNFSQGLYKRGSKGFCWLLLLLFCSVCICVCGCECAPLSYMRYSKQTNKHGLWGGERKQIDCCIAQVCPTPPLRGCDAMPYNTFAIWDHKNWCALNTKRIWRGRKRLLLLLLLLWSEVIGNAVLCMCVCVGVYIVGYKYQCHLAT